MCGRSSMRARVCVCVVDPRNCINIHVLWFAWVDELTQLLLLLAVFICFILKMNFGTELSTVLSYFACFVVVVVAFFRC